MFQADGHLGFTRCLAVLSKAKSLAQWRAKALGLRVPEDGVLAARSAMDLGRFIFIKWADSADEGTVVSADLKSKNTFRSPEATTWMEQ